MKDLKELKYINVIGFSGSISHGLQVIGRDELIYPVGNNIGILSGTKDFDAKSSFCYSMLQGHNYPISTLTVSKSEKYAASADGVPPNQKASIIIWSLEKKRSIGSYAVHKEGINNLAISTNDQFVFSLGAYPDFALVIWSIERKTPLGYIQAGGNCGVPSLLCSAPLTTSMVAIGGQRILKIFSFDKKQSQFQQFPIHLGLLVRNYTNIKIDKTEEFLYGSTTSGDIVKVRLNIRDNKASPALVVVMKPKPLSLPDQKKLQPLLLPAINAFDLLPNGKLIIGDAGGTVRYFAEDLNETQNAPVQKKSLKGHGTLEMVRPKDPTTAVLSQVWATTLKSEITSVSVKNGVLYIGTKLSEIYKAHLISNEKMTNNEQERRFKNFQSVTKHCQTTSRKTIPEFELISSCHSGAVFDVCFPRGVSDLVVTAGEYGLRVWNVRNLQEKLKCDLPGIICFCCDVSIDLSTIISGWADGRIRGIGAEIGTIKWIIEDAHFKGVVSLIAFKSGLIASGGVDGRVRLWSQQTQIMWKLVVTQREHRGEVKSIVTNETEELLLSCSVDGTCILWRVPTLERVFILKAHSVFLGASILHSGDILTVGNDGKLSAWDRSNATLLAELPVDIGTLTSIHTSSDDKRVVVSSEAGQIQMWDWKKAKATHTSTCHGKTVTKLKFSPDGTFFVSTGKDGCLIFWSIPDL